MGKLTAVTRPHNHCPSLCTRDNLLALPSKSIKSPITGSIQNIIRNVLSPIVGPKIDVGPAVDKNPSCERENSGAREWCPAQESARSEWWWIGTTTCSIIWRGRDQGPSQRPADRSRARRADRHIERSGDAEVEVHEVPQEAHEHPNLSRPYPLPLSHQNLMAQRPRVLPMIRTRLNAGSGEAEGLRGHPTAV
ncbi:hypothetical protein PS2_039513 [Malus domestica]